jgi:glycine/D-amino acid oxidase-like deaminating enzyme
MKSLKVAIIGAGFAGLSLAWHLLSLNEKFSCTLFDEKGIGQGASGIASGLLHPFPGASTHYSFKGNEAMHESILLLKAAMQHSQEMLADFSGILKLALDDEDKRQYSQLIQEHERLSWLQVTQVKKELPYMKPCPALNIEQGVTVFCERYLGALWRACEANKAELKQQRIQHFSELKNYDVKILCAGSSIRQFDPTLKLQAIKGQILTCKVPYPLSSRSLIAKGYLAITPDPLVYHLGSTYEHHYKEEIPCMETAKALLFEKGLAYIKDMRDFQVLECRAAVRIANPKTHLPLIKKYSESEYAVTGLGSRGLLYHGLIGKQLAESIFYQDERRISREFFLS